MIEGHFGGTSHNCGRLINSRRLACSSILVVFALSVVCGEEKLIGWLGETYGKNVAQSAPQAESRIVLSWEPRIFLYKQFLTPDECDRMIAMAKPRLERSGVSDSLTGAGNISDIRTSHGMFFDRHENDLVGRVEERLATWTLLPAGNGEGIQVLHYEKTEKYDPHHDYFSFEGRDDNGGNRMATVLMYLSDVEEGGETVFPKVRIPPTQTKEHFSTCAMKGLAVKPSKGDAIAFWSIRPDGRFDAASLHGSCPVIRGEKWSATKWIHVGHYGMNGEAEVKVERIQYVPPPPPTPPGCLDKHALCPHWAESGECESNPGFMVGTAGQPGSCIRSCNRCDLGPNIKDR